MYILSESIADCNFAYSGFNSIPFCIYIIYIYRLHRLLDDGTDDKKPSFHQLITASRKGIAADLEQGHQVR